MKSQNQNNEEGAAENAAPSFVIKTYNFFKFILKYTSWDSYI